MEEIVRTPHRPLAVLAVFVVVGPLIGAAIALLPLAPFMLLTRAPGLLLLAGGYPMGAVPAAATGVMANIAIAKWPRPAFLPTCAVTGGMASAAGALVNIQSADVLAWLPFTAIGVVAALGTAGVVHLLGLRGRTAPSARAPSPPPGPGPRLALPAGDVLLIVLGVVMAVMIVTLLIPALA
ncbi:hypothetical protein LJR164_003500 [Phenylobacterium sp. LjRoot164]|uniref:hypothetical protein n=1 Tax=unclassified Phenylobacterium TaxID=2640670 RepID=UPI003ED168FD